MIGSIDPALKKAHVVGAGIAGLLIADFLDRAGFEVYLHEASPRTGGLLCTTETEFGIAEAAAHSLLATDAVKAIFEANGVKLLPLRARARYVLRDGKLQKFPLRIREAIGAFLRAYFMLSTPRIANGQATLDEWARRIVGPHALKFFLQPFVRGIYGAQPEELNLEAAFPALQIPKGHSFISFMLKKKIRGQMRPHSKMMAPEKGIGSFVDHLSLSLKTRLGSRMLMNQSVLDLTLFSDSNVILSVPSHEAGRLLWNEAKVLSEKLTAVDYTSLISVTVFIAHTAFPKKPPQGVGVLIPKEEGRRALGILFNSSSFEGRTSDQQTVSMTVILGGSLDREVLNATDIQIETIVDQELKAIFKTRGSPEKFVIHRWPRAVPKYNESLVHTWMVARTTWCSRPGHILFGNYTGQVSLRGMIEAVSNLKSTAS